MKIGLITIAAALLITSQSFALECKNAKGTRQTVKQSSCPAGWTRVTPINYSVNLPQDTALDCKLVSTWKAKFSQCKDALAIAAQAPGQADYNAMLTACNNSKAGNCKIDFDNAPEEGTIGFIRNGETYIKTADGKYARVQGTTPGSKNKFLKQEYLDQYKNDLSAEQVAQLKGYDPSNNYGTLSKEAQAKRNRIDYKQDYIKEKNGKMYKTNADGKFVDASGNEIADGSTSGLQQVYSRHDETVAAQKRFDDAKAAVKDLKHGRDLDKESNYATDSNSKAATINGNQTQDVHAMRDEKQDARHDLRVAKRAERQAGRKLAREEEMESIANENTTQNYGGRYGGKNVATTQQINQGVEMARTTFEQMATNSLSNRNGAEAMALNSKGMTATQTDAYKSQMKMISNGAKAIGTQSTITKGIAAYQLYRGYQHERSKNDVQEAADYANKNVVGQMKTELADLQQQYAAAPAAEKSALAKQIVQKQTDIAYTQNMIKTNRAGENQAQDAAMVGQMVAAAQTSLKAMQLDSEKKAALNQAAMMQGYVDGTNGQGFVFNPNPVNPNPGGNDPNNPNDNPNQVIPGDNGEQGIQAGNENMNPNMGDGGLEAPAPGAFVAGDPNKGGQGGPAGSGLGGGGGTSAAKDDSKGQGEGPGKAQAGGSFAAGDGGGSGSRFSRSGGGSGGADNSWLEMMKKFLPGGEDVAKHDERMDMSDRSIASDQPSVLGRNKNIFEEVSKKYQIKNNEGAVVFTGDRS